MTKRSPIHRPELIRRDLQRSAIDQVDQLLLDGVNSGPPERIDEQWWKDRRAELARHRRERAKKSKRA